MILRYKFKALYMLGKCSTKEVYIQPHQSILIRKINRPFRVTTIGSSVGLVMWLYTVSKER